MILSNYDLKSMVKSRRLVISPFYKDTIRENGVDMRLADEIARHASHNSDFVMDPLDPAKIKSGFKIEKHKKEMVLDSKEQVLLSTYEYIEVPDDIAGFVELRSTWARHGLSMPPTIIDAGFKGTITLEVINNAPYKILLRPRQRFAHVIFVKLASKADAPYSGYYNGQVGIRLPQPIR